MIRQRTLKISIQATGIGVHTGKKVYLTLRPAPANTGIIFRRVDLDDPVEILAHPTNMGDATLSTCLTKGGVRIATIEHLMSALSGLGIDNLYVDLNEPELPIMDGSAAPFVFLIQSAGIEEQDAPKKFIRIKRRVEIQQNDKLVRLEPFEGFKVKFRLEYDHPVLNESSQCTTVDLSLTSYAKEVARARTFGFLSDYEYIRKNNLALGASLDNAIVLDEYKVLNEDGLRYPDEFVKHKILDVIGDLYLLGYSVIGQFTGYKSGHALNGQLLKKVLADEKAWEIVTFDDPEKAPIYFSPVIAAA
ncbi:MAG: UDP-3-O-acyl-N-acetylglucosamine deacetylase [Rhodospirillaceae bacterium]|jgi:UDP-3-O-[3-hydroxymyristoyl] N-acetylglucosamine deacetylase|nr:UDP-3-O-acyl-N-acetylglucosamine deacetylase [Rhodospirillaceae bacterium]